MLKWFVLALIAGFGAACSAVALFGERAVFETMVRPVLETPYWQLAGWSLIGFAIDAMVLFLAARVVARIARRRRD